MDKKELQEFAEFYKEHNLSELFIEFEGKKIHLKNTFPFEKSTGYSHINFDRIKKEKVSVSKNEKTEEQLKEPPNLKIISSPISGVFYLSPAPASPPYVQIGDRVNPDSVICIVEAMKIMNEIKAECSGIVKEILVKNEDTITQGDPIIKIELS